MSDLQQARQELLALEKQAGEEASEHALAQIQKHLPHMNISAINVYSNPESFMQFSLQGGSDISEFFRVTFKDGVFVYSEMDRTRSTARQYLYIVHPSTKKKQQNVLSRLETPASLGLNPSKTDTITKFWEKDAAWLGIKDGAGFEETIIRIQRWWADLEAALVIYITYMNKSPIAAQRPGSLAYFGHLFSKIHDSLS